VHAARPPLGLLPILLPSERGQVKPVTDLGGRIAHVWLPTAAGLISTLDMLDDGLTLFTGPDQTPWHTAAGHVSGPLPLAVRSLDTITARDRLASVRGGALLCRPDGAAIGSWPDPDNATNALRAAVASARAGGPRPASAGSAALSEREVA